LGVFESYRLRVKRKRYQARARLKRHELVPLRDLTDAIRPHDILAVLTMRNERLRLTYFLDYYRKLGINHFLIVDNGSTDGTLDYLAEQPDVSLWESKGSYKKARYGLDWQNWLLRKYAHNHWSLVVDTDEFLVYPFCDTRPLRALTDWLDSSSIRSFSSMMVDMYPKGGLSEQPYQDGQDPFEIAGWFDSGNYSIEKNHKYGNLWIQGGPRRRVFFSEAPEQAPALNKIPLVKWDKRYVYVSSTHMLLPRGLNLVYDESGGEKASGALLHAKFLDTFTTRAAEEVERKQHYATSAEYKAYVDKMNDDPQLWCKWSEKYINWRQLEILGLMSKGNWA
jgi:hypothetical protein